MGRIGSLGIHLVRRSWLACLPNMACTPPSFTRTAPPRRQTPTFVLCNTLSVPTTRPTPHPLRKNQAVLGDRRPLNPLALSSNFTRRMTTYQLTTRRTNFSVCLWPSLRAGMGLLEITRHHQSPPPARLPVDYLDPDAQRRLSPQ